MWRRISLGRDFNNCTTNSNRQPEIPHNKSTLFNCDSALTGTLTLTPSSSQLGSKIYDKGSLSTPACQTVGKS